MEYIVLNLEGNRMKGSIAQIGAARVNEKMDVEDTFQMKVEGGREELMEAMEKFRLWCGDCPLVTWGQDDIWLLESCISENGLDLDWMPEVFDGQEIFDEQMESRRGSDLRADLNYAMIVLGMKPRAVKSALTRSLYVVKVLQNLSFSRGIESQRWGIGMCDYGYELA